MLEQSQVDQFWNEGFLSIPQLIDSADVAALRAAYDELLSGAIDVPTDRNLGGITRQVMVPSMLHPTFDDNAALRAGRKVMVALFGAAHANRTYDMLIDKPAGHPHETPWHQDAGYFAMPVAGVGTVVPLTSIQFWVALDDCDADNGCMQFLPGRHRDATVEHVVVSGHPDDEGRLIGFADSVPVPQAEIVACPLPAGGATIHTALTPHYTGPNRSADRGRRAYIFNLVAAAEADDTIESRVRAGYVRTIAASVERGIAVRPR